MAHGPIPVAWNVDTLRSTILFSPTVPHVPRPLWADLVGGVCTFTQREDGTIEEVGAFQEHYLTVTQVPMRVDLVWHEGRAYWDQNRLVAEGERLPVVGMFRGPGNLAYDGLVRRFVGQCGRPVQIAYAPILSFAGADLATVYRLLQNRLRVDLNGNRVSDFLFQINRWRISEVAPGAKVNRLTRWSAMQLVRLEVARQGAATNALQVVVAQAARVEMDVNLVHEDGRLLVPGELGAILDELIELSNELALDGDQP